MVEHVVNGDGADEPPLVVDESAHPLAAGDRYLFATDGVSRVLTEAPLADALADVVSPTETLRHLIDLVLRRGAPDNATAVLVVIDEV